MNKGWCNRCDFIREQWTKLAEELDGEVNVGKVNCDTSMQLCRKYEIFSIF